MQNMSCGSVRRLLRVAASFNPAVNKTAEMSVVRKIATGRGGLLPKR